MAPRAAHPTIEAHSATATTDERIRVTERAIGRAMSDWSLHGSVGSASGPGAPGATIERMARAHVIVVDDEPSILTTLQKALSLEGYAVDVAGGVKVAEEKLKKRTYELCLFDVQLPDGDGIGKLHVEEAELVGALLELFFGDLHAAGDVDRVALERERLLEGGED